MLNKDNVVHIPSLFFKIRPITLPPMPRLPLSFPNKIMCAPLFATTRATCLAHLILLNVAVLVTFGDRYQA
jgi:hypothetical protein